MKGPGGLFEAQVMAGGLFEIDIWIPGEPKGQPRPRAFARTMPSGKTVARVYDAGTAEGWKGEVARAVGGAQHGPPWTGPVFVSLAFLMPRPSSMRRKRPHAEDGQMAHSKKPDLDNLAKAVLDALTQIRLWEDDSQVSMLTLSKSYHADKGKRPGLHLKARPLSPVGFLRASP